MRYFEFALKTSSEQIKKNAKIRLKEYDYQSPVAAMNNYMYKNMKRFRVPWQNLRHLHPGLRDGAGLVRTATA